MRNIWFILRRDLRRLIRVPAAWVVVIGIMLVPCMYAWFNVAGFWNPYGNTGRLKVAVANDDKGADSSLLGKINIGDQLETELKTNHQLGWTFLSYDESMHCVKSGECYAAIVIPADFSADLASIVAGSDKRPQLDYYVNEKLNAIAPRITGVGASTVDRQVNSAFVSTASKVISTIVNQANTTITNSSNSTVEETSKQLESTSNNLKATRELIAGLRKTLSTTQTRTDAAKEALAQTEATMQTAGTGLNAATNLLTTSQNSLNTFTSQAGAQMDKGSSLFLQASGQATSDATRVANGVITATGYANSAIGTLQNVNTQNASVLADLNTIDLSSVNAQLNTQFHTILSQLEQDNANTKSALDTANTLNTQTRNTANSTLSTISTFNTASTTTLDSISQARSQINSGALPKLNSGLSSLAATGGTLSGMLSGDNTLISQTNLVLTQIGDMASSSANTLASTDSLLNTFSTQLETAKTDLDILRNANIMSDLTGSNGQLNAERIANFMLSPTVLNTHVLYPVPTYGASIAPLFTSLSLWVGMFMIMAIMKLEVDNEGLEDRHPTTTQTYIARYLLLSIISLAQGIICTIGDLIIGVPTVNRFMFVLTGVVVSLSYLSIGYALSTTFLHLGKALIIVLVMVQIPGASGLYPIEMMPEFYRALYPFFPFTYTINAFRETIGGFYGDHWLRMITMLLVFALIGFLIGIIGRPMMTGFNHLFAREVAESDMIVSERIYVPERRFNLTQAIHVLADQGAYRQQIQQQAARFERWYPRLMRGALVVGLVVPIAFFITFSFTDSSKLFALAAWVVWLLLMVGFLMTVELIRDSLRRQAELGTLSDDSLRTVIMNGGRLSPSEQTAIRDAASTPVHARHAAQTTASTSADTAVMPPASNTSEDSHSGKDAA